MSMSYLVAASSAGFCYVAINSAEEVADQGPTLF